MSLAEPAANAAEPHTAGGAPPPRLAVRVRRVAGLPLVAARLWLRGGMRLEETPGQALVTGRLLAGGSRRRGWDRIAVEAEDRGMVLQSFGGTETQGVAIDALAEDWQLALEWLAELALEPVFPEDRLAWICRQAAAELESQLDQPEVRTARAFLTQLYHPHPYGRPLQGDGESLSRLAPEHCAALHRRALGWGGCVVVTGEIDEAAVERRVRELFADLDGPAVAPPAVAPPGGLEARRRLTAGEGEQAHLYAGHLTVPRNHPDLIALEVVAVALGAGAGLAGRLPERIREKEGLAYSLDVATASGSGHDPGRLVTYVGTSPATVEQAERAVREELERLLEGGLGEVELEEARSYLLGRDPFRRETCRQWADILAESELYGLPTDRPEWVAERLRELTREQAEAAARRWIRPAELKVTVGSPGG